MAETRCPYISKSGSETMSICSYIKTTGSETRYFYIITNLERDQMLRLSRTVVEISCYFIKATGSETRCYCIKQLGVKPNVPT